MRIYLAGPMTGLPDHNFPAFNLMADVLRRAKFTVFNPAENEAYDPPRDLAYYMAIDLPEVCRADAVFLLPGWRESKGAQCEEFVATSCGIPVFETIVGLVNWRDGERLRAKFGEFEG